MTVYTPKPAPFDAELVPRYIETELIAIAENLNSAVQRAYGGLFLVSIQDVPLTPGVSVFNAFDTELPNQSASVGVLVSIPDSKLTILTAGVYLVDFSSTAFNIAVNAEFQFVLAKNGIPGPANGRLDPSNQTNEATIAFGGIVDYVRGDELTILASSATSDTWSAENSQFFVHRVSESHD